MVQWPVGFSVRGLTTGSNGGMGNVILVGLLKSESRAFSWDCGLMGRGLLITPSLVSKAGTDLNDCSSLVGVDDTTIAGRLRICGWNSFGEPIASTTLPCLLGESCVAYRFEVCCCMLPESDVNPFAVPGRESILIGAWNLFIFVRCFEASASSR